MRILQRLAPLWQTQRRRRPGLTDRVDAAALVVRTRGDLAGEVRDLRTRLAELERDHRLLAAHVASLTEQGGPGAAGGDADEEGRHQRARLAAIAFYEERIGRLEEQAARPRRGDRS